MGLAPSEGWEDDDLAEAVTDCIETLYAVYEKEGSEMSNFFLDDVTKKPPGKLKRAKILAALREIVESLCKACQ